MGIIANNRSRLGRIVRARSLKYPPLRPQKFKERALRLLLREKECNFGEWTEILCAEERDQSKHILVGRIFILAKN